MSECPSLISPLLSGSTAYRERAERLRAMADDLPAREWRDILVRLANAYDEMASTSGGSERYQA